MPDRFELKLLGHRFLTDDLTDVCSHGEIYLRVNDFQLCGFDDGDWNINESALSLMRSVKYGFPNQIPPKYYPDGWEEDVLINHCGVYMAFCPSTISWNATIQGNYVVLHHFVKNGQALWPELSATLPLRSYAQHIMNFAMEAKRLFDGIQMNYTASEFFDGQYHAFWAEYEELLHELGPFL